MNHKAVFCALIYSVSRVLCFIVSGLFSQLDLNRPMKEQLTELTKYPIQTRISMSGVMVVARDLAHAKLKERLTSGKGLPDYIKNHPVYYAGCVGARG